MGTGPTYSQPPLKIFINLWKFLGTGKICYFMEKKFVEKFDFLWRKKGRQTEFKRKALRNAIQNHHKK